MRASRAPPSARRFVFGANSVICLRAPREAHVACLPRGSSPLVRSNEIFHSEPTASALACNKWLSGGNSRRSPAARDGNGSDPPFPERATISAAGSPSPR
ncbi:hypothetical protein MTO96_001435 [Rhipicephalus appendiculatus]